MQVAYRRSAISVNTRKVMGIVQGTLIGMVWRRSIIVIIWSKSDITKNQNNSTSGTRNLLIWKTY